MNIMIQQQGLENRNPITLDDVEVSIYSRYRKIAIEVYGEACEWIGCGWSAASCDVHHIDYQEQWEYERKLRALFDQGEEAFEEYQAFVKEAHEKGYGFFNSRNRQLHKNDHPSNLTVLCPNHHRYVHTQDLGMKLLSFVPQRKDRGE